MQYSELRVLGFRFSILYIKKFCVLYGERVNVSYCIVESQCPETSDVIKRFLFCVVLTHYFWLILTEADKLLGRYTQTYRLHLFHYATKQPYVYMSDSEYRYHCQSILKHYLSYLKRERKHIRKSIDKQVLDMYTNAICIVYYIHKLQSHVSVPASHA